MTTRKDVEVQFARWNVMGTGPDRLTSGNWFFRRHVLFYSSGPYKRFVRRANGTMVSFDKQPADTIEVFTKPTPTALPGNDKNPGFAYEHWSLPTIGVHSRYEGDELSEAELHERMRYLFIAELGMAEQDYVTPLGGNEVTGHETAVTAKVARMYARYDNYSKTFALKWPELPTFYKDQIAAALKLKWSRYHDPKAVAQRERTHARKVAKQAFELDE